MNWVDFVILAVVFASVIIGLMRGFAREALSLVGWVLAVWVSVTFSDELQRLLQPYIDSQAGRTAVAIAILFILTLLVAALVNYLVAELVKKAGLTVTDRVVGVFFGFVRGCALVAVLVLLAGLTSLPHDGWWRNSQLLHYFQDMALWLRAFLPPEVAENIRYG